MTHGCTDQADHAIAVIPARGGSKGVPRKNLAEVGGRSLIRRAVDACLAATSVGHVVVSTDDPEIAAEAHRAGAGVVHRPAELATDESTSESAIVHALAAVGRPASIVLFVQCTSPFIESADLDRAVELVAAGHIDVAFSAVPFHGFLWRPDDGPGFSGVNHDASIRARRQDRGPEVLETGAFYAFDRDGFEAAGHRFFGTVAPVFVRPDAAIEIDDMDDLALARSMAPISEPSNLSDVRAVVTDFDGVHTDNLALVDECGSESVRINRGDGLGVSMLRSAGVPVLILSTETNPVVLRRAEKLGVDCISGCDDKATALGRWLDAAGIDHANTLYIGNDENDADCLQAVGIPVVVADAHHSVRPHARWVTTARGGGGAVREVADAVLRSHVPPLPLEEVDHVRS